jgi:hypothetical protein
MDLFYKNLRITQSGFATNLRREIAINVKRKSRPLNKARGVQRDLISNFLSPFSVPREGVTRSSLRSQFATSNKGRGGRRYAPYAFTEQGVAMLSTVLNSERAIQVNIEIMRAFVRLRQILASNTELARKMHALEKKYDAQFKVVFDAIRQLMTPPEPKKRKIAFLVEEKAAAYGRR